MNPFDLGELSKISLADFQALLEECCPSSKHVQYHPALRLFPCAGDLEGDLEKRKLDFLRDAASFANTMGGCLIFGIEANEGYPTRFSGFQVDSEDKLVEKIRQLFHEKITPSLRDYKIRSFRAQDGNLILLLHINSGTESPYVVVEKSSRWFDARADEGRYLIENYDSKWAQAQFRLKKIIEFRQKRIAETLRGNYPFQVPDRARIMVHLIPISTFEEQSVLDFAEQENNCRDFSTFIEHSTTEVLQNSDGLVAWYSCDGQISYNQWFKNGVFEVIDNCFFCQNSDDKIIPQKSLECSFIVWLQRSLKLLRQRSIGTPYYLMVSLLNVKGFKVSDQRKFQVGIRDEISRSSLLFPPIMISKNSQRPDKILHPIFDWIWNSSGYARCPDFESDGTWKGDLPAEYFSLD